GKAAGGGEGGGRAPGARTRRRPGRTGGRPPLPARLRIRPNLGSAVTRRRAMAAAVAVLLLWAVYMLFIRNLPLFSIDEVTVTGATTNEQAIKTAVEQDAGGITT